MKYGKLISKLTKKSDNSGYVAVAIVAGLAAGAILSLLFAPESGAGTRKLISGKAKELCDNSKENYITLKNKILGNTIELEDEVAPEIPHFVNSVPKKRKSDIADIIHEAHAQKQTSEN